MLGIRSEGLGLISESCTRLGMQAGFESGHDSELCAAAARDQVQAPAAAYSGVEQMEAQRFHTPQVAGSIPAPAS